MRVQQGRCRSLFKHWNICSGDAYDCSQEQTMEHFSHDAMPQAVALKTWPFQQRPPAYAPPSGAHIFKIFAQRKGEEDWSGGSQVLVVASPCGVIIIRFWCLKLKPHNSVHWLASFHCSIEIGSENLMKASCGERSLARGLRTEP